MELIEDIMGLLHGLIFNSFSKIEMQLNPNRPVSPEERDDIMNMIHPLRSYGGRAYSVYYGLKTPEGLRHLRNLLDEGIPDVVLQYLSTTGLDSDTLERIESDIYDGAEEYISNKEKREKEALQIQQMMATTPGLNQIPANVGPTIAHFVTGAYVPPPTGGSTKKKRKGAKKTRKMKRRGRKTVRK
jgi:hypothetical protein